MTITPPAEIHLTSHRAAWWMLFPAAAIGLLAVAAFGSTLIFDEGPSQGSPDWAVPAAGIGGMVAMVLLLWVGTVMVERATERRRVRRVYATALACWPQYATEPQWQQAIAKADRPERHFAEIAWPMGILTVVLGGIGVPAGFSGVWSVTVVLAAFWVLLFGLVAGRRWNADRERRADLGRRRRLTPYPSCCISADAFYDEDRGLVGLEQVTGVRVVAPDEVPQLRKRLLSGARKGELTVELDAFDTRLARAGWSLLQFTVDERVARTLWHHLQALLRAGQHGFSMPISVTHVRVPPGREAEAAQVAAAVARRWRTTDGGTPLRTGTEVSAGRSPGRR
jgi:hypothetical protein